MVIELKDKIEILLETITSKNPLQKKYLEKTGSGIGGVEYEELERVISYFERRFTVEEMADAYLLFVNDTRAETKYFVENGCMRYRYATYREVAEKVYNDENYMGKYMLGLQLSGYLWENHRMILKWFREKTGAFHGENYLEIGPGHGQYFAEAVQLGKFESYTAVDISETSLAMTAEYLREFVPEADDIRLLNGDFLDMAFDREFQGVCISEVLEHVEDPAAMLRKIFEVTSSDAEIYVNVPLNAPEVDHIYLFHEPGEVRTLCREAGFQIVDELLISANGKPIDVAMKKKQAMNFAFIMKKGERR